MHYIRRDTTTQFVDSVFIVSRLTLDGMQRWRILIDGKHSGRLRSVMAPDDDTARQKAIDFYQIEPTLVRVVPITSNRTKPKARDQLDDLWHRRPASLF
jgi:hypothetical protein